MRVLLLGLFFPLVLWAEFGVYGEALYWKAANGSFPIASFQTNTTSPNANFDRRCFDIQGGHDLGWRAGGSYRHCSWDVALSGLYIRTSDDGRALPSRNLSAATFVDFVSNRVAIRSGGVPILGEELVTLRIAYWNVDASGGYSWCPSDFITMRFCLGVRHVDIDVCLRRRGVIDAASPQLNIANMAQRCLRSCGTGPSVGIGSSIFPFCTPFRAEVSACLMSLVSRQHLTLPSFFNENGTLVSFVNPRGRLLSPGFDFELALAYGLPCWDLRLGYALHYYWNFLENSTLTGVATWDGLHSRNVGFGGPFVSLALRY